MNLNRLCLILLVAFLSLGPSRPPLDAAAQEGAKKEYVCPPCGCSRDGHVYDHPGACTACGMELVERGAAQQPPPAAQAPVERKRAAILVFEGVQIIDYTGPYEVFGQAGFDTFVVASSSEPITTAMGMKVTPNYSLDNAPQANVLVIPGGGVNAALNDERVVKWIVEKSKEADYVLTVCNGAYIAARAGLLDGLTATTFYDLLNDFAEFAPKTRVVRDQRYVDNGRVITTAGISSGIDGSLYVVSKMLGKARAQMAALNMEYNWQPDSRYARANFADRHIRKLFGRNLRLSAPPGMRALVLSTEGSSEMWEVGWQVEGEASAASIMDALNERLSVNKWTRANKAFKGAAKSLWRFTDEDGGVWSGSASAVENGERRFTVKLRIDRKSAPAARSKSGSPAGDPSAASSEIVIRDAWIQEMPPSQGITAAYLVIDNRSQRETALVAARAEIAGTVEMHRVVNENQMMRMRKLDRIPIPSGSTELTGDLHLMLIGLKSPVKEGDRVEIALEFENAVVKKLLIPVRRRQAR